MPGDPSSARACSEGTNKWAAAPKAGGTQPDGLPAAHPSCRPHKGDLSHRGFPNSSLLTRPEAPWGMALGLSCCPLCSGTCRRDSPAPGVGGSHLNPHGGCC
uniref:Uncharacterized protein n=1 Tax=Anas zonorhyncha TaxID=75864 RepID=A0A8B9UH91_9AVES